MRRIRCNISQLDNILEGLCDDFYTEHVKEMAKTTVSRVPVASGRARGSITASVGSPEIIDNRFDPSGSAAKSDIDNFRAKIGQTAYVTAGVPYAGIIEFGNSKTPANGFMRRTVNEAQRHANDAARDL